MDPRQIAAKAAQQNADRARNAEQLAGAVMVELQQRALPTLSEMIDALNYRIAAAKAGDEAARQIVRQFCKALDDAREANSPIQVVRNGDAAT